MEISVKLIKSKIFEIRGHKVMLDVDLAEMYEVETKRLKESVKRNLKRFPFDFMFTLTQKEAEQGIYQPLLPSKELASLNPSKGGTDVNIAIIRTFVLVKQSVMDYKDLTANLKKLERKSNKNFKELFTALDYLITKKQEEGSIKDRQRIGFKPDKM